MEEGMDEATRERNHQLILRDLGRIEGRVDALESRMQTIDKHLGHISDKLDDLTTTLNQRIGKDRGTAGFWAILVAVITLGIAGATLYENTILFQERQDAVQAIEDLTKKLGGGSPGFGEGSREGDYVHID